MQRSLNPEEHEARTLYLLLKQNKTINKIKLLLRISYTTIKGKGNYKKI